MSQTGSNSRTVKKAAWECKSVGIMPAAPSARDRHTLLSPARPIHSLRLHWHSHCSHPLPILEPVPFHIDIWDPSQVRRHRVDDRSHLRPSPLSGSTFLPRTGCREEYSKTTAVVALFSLIYICPLPPCPPPKKNPTCCKKILSQLIFLKSTAAEVCGRWCLNAFESVTMKHDFKVSLSCRRRIAKTPCWTCLQN